MFNKETLDRIDELKRNEELLYNCIDYLQQLWGIEHKNTQRCFKDIGFREEDIERLEIEVE
jgi:hypothetical protein